MLHDPLFQSCIRDRFQITVAGQRLLAIGQHQRLPADRIQVPRLEIRVFGRHHAQLHFLNVIGFGPRLKRLLITVQPENDYPGTGRFGQPIVVFFREST